MSGKKDVLHVGIDLGTSRSAIAASNGERHVVESYVGWPVDMVARKVVKKAVLFGHEALENRPMLDLHRPLERGLIKEGSPKAEAAVRELLAHLIERAGGAGKTVHAVVGVPAEAMRVSRQHLRNAVKGVADSLLLVSEPFAVAYGMDALLHTMIIDIGAGTSDFCVMNGRYPTDDDQRTPHPRGRLGRRAARPPDPHPPPRGELLDPHGARLEGEVQLRRRAEGARRRGGAGPRKADEPRDHRRDEEGLREPRRAALGDDARPPLARRPGVPAAREEQRRPGGWRVADPRPRRGARADARRRGRGEGPRRGGSRLRRSERLPGHRRGRPGGRLGAPGGMSGEDLTSSRARRMLPSVSEVLRELTARAPIEPEIAFRAAREVCAEELKRIRDAGGESVPLEDLVQRAFLLATGAALSEAPPPPSPLFVPPHPPVPEPAEVATRRPLKLPPRPRIRSARRRGRWTCAGIAMDASPSARRPPPADPPGASPRERPNRSKKPARALSCSRRSRLRRDRRSRSRSLSPRKRSRLSQSRNRSRSLRRFSLRSPTRQKVRGTRPSLACRGKPSRWISTPSSRRTPRPPPCRSPSRGRTEKSSGLPGALDPGPSRSRSKTTRTPS
ncbi:MAG: rod shape-determining protein [Holophagales bacterium]|nr:rod shape-determining protein [Holophagales bacterium]